MVLRLAESDEKTGPVVVGTALEQSVAHPYLHAQAEQFRAIPPYDVGATAGAVYVGQGEFCAIERSGNKGQARMVGTDDATTCLMVVLHAEEEDLVLVTHIGTSEDMQDNLSLLEASLGVHAESRVNAWLVGGFEDARGLSKEVASSFLAGMQHSLVEYKLQLAHVCSLNNTREPRPLHPDDDGNRPIMRGILVHLDTGSSSQALPVVVPARFTDRGICSDLRSAFSFCSSTSELRSVYSRAEGCISLDLPNWPAAIPYNPSLDVLISMLESGSPDHVTMALCTLSTSPFAEQDRFVMDTVISLITWRAMGRDGLPSGTLRYALDPATMHWGKLD